jgi:hypothetical protein
MRSVFSSLAMVVALSVTANVAKSDGPVTYKVLDQGAAQLREDFNAAKGSVRVLFVVDPICPGCLRGLDDVNKDLLSKTNDPRLQAFVVHVPVLTPPPSAKDVPEAATLLRNDHVHHYWNPSGSFGEELSAAVGLKHGDEPVYAWDVWLIYGPEATWEAASPPRPQRLMHQLYLLKDSTEFPRLNSRVFAQEVHQLLTQIPEVHQVQ